MSDELKPLLDCPFCGGTPEIREDHSFVGSYTVKCARCGCGTWVGAKRTVCESWQRRAPVPPRTSAKTLAEVGVSRWAKPPRTYTITLTGGGSQAVQFDSADQAAAIAADMRQRGQDKEDGNE